jgi:outer membrane immunogenic protein
MKKFLLVSIAISALGTAPALSADMAVKARPMVAPVAVSTWTGCYVGVNGGWKGGRFGESVDTPAGVAVLPAGTSVFAADHIDLNRLNVDSGAVGGQVGCRWESADHWVVGVEGDFDWTDLHGTVVSNTFGTGRSVLVPGDFFDNRARWESSVRGIVGRSFDKFLIYATGGLAVTDVRMGGNFIGVPGPVPLPASAGFESKTLFGFTVGAGAAYAFSPNWDIGAEYRFSQYSGANFRLGQIAVNCMAGNNTETCFFTDATGHKDLRTNEVLFKLNYRFNPAGAVVAKY